MKKPNRAPESTMDLIIEKLLTNLKKDPEFEKEDIKHISELAKSGDLSNTTAIENVIKANRVE